MWRTATLVDQRRSMSPSNQSADLRWGYFAQVLNIGSGLLLLPFVVHYLPTEQVGLWFVFITLGALAQLLEFGFQPTVARNTVYVYAGARTLAATGMPVNLHNARQPHLPLLTELIHACKLIYRIVALLASLALLIGGSIYVGVLAKGLQEPLPIIIAWVMYAVGTLANFYFGYANALLQGRGDVTLANKTLIASRAGLLTLGLVGLVCGLGLPGLGGAMLVSCVIGRWLAMRYLRRDSSMRSALENRATPSRVIARTMWHNASRLGVVQVSAFLIQRANVLVASSFLGLAAAANYGLTVTILMTLSNVAMAVLQIRLPALTRARTTNDHVALRAMLGEVLLISWMLFAVGLILLVAAGNPLLALLAGKNALLPNLQLLIFGTILALEMNHSIAATFLTTRNAVPFLWPSIISGIATLLLSLALVNSWGVWGLIAAQGLVQLAFNNWRWPWIVQQELNSSWFELFAAGAKKLRSHFETRAA
jgi:O-antigen/teichoic acid export membrane protein